MRKKVHTVMISLSLWVSALAVVAQTPGGDSLMTTDRFSEATASGSGRMQTTQRYQPDQVLIRRIPVQAGDSVSISTTILGKTQRGRQFWTSIAKVVTPGFVVGALETRKEKTSSLSESIPAGSTVFASTLAITPGVVNLVKKQSKSRAFIGIVAFDTAGQPVSRSITRLNKVARKGDQTLEAGYRVTQDGYVTVLGDRDPSIVCVGNSENPDNWIKFALHRTKAVSKEISPSDTIGSARLAAGGVDGLQLEPGNGGPQTNGLQMCIDWYWCNSDGCRYTGETYCEALNDGGGGVGIGYQGDPTMTAMGKCSQSLNIALERCFRSFATKMAAAAAMGEAVPAALTLIIESIVENYFCKESAYQDFDICTTEVRTGIPQPNN
ncbi:hypothetical protein [Spirosoma validum]|uniref:Uncharacterized protein n=1 Tax=Spirosoma validum TaxID=2771355 RepID=A0A927AX40_9BACT|nr:hypothetical protein [Spirosoma validum]MBD2751363.1 hypothetical protein [Spirosoma validum]